MTTNLIDDKDFIEKKLLYCEHKCNFKFIPTIIVKDGPEERICQGAVLCQYCAYFDTIDINIIPDTAKDALQKSRT